MQFLFGSGLFSNRDNNILPKKELHRSLTVRRTCWKARQSPMSTPARRISGDGPLSKEGCYDLLT